MIEVFGASDDLILVTGDIDTEFDYQADSHGRGHFLAFSDGTMLHVELDDDCGVWRIKLIQSSEAEGQGVTIVSAPEGVEDDYSDRAILSGPEEIRWVVLGSHYALAGS